MRVQWSSRFPVACQAASALLGLVLLLVWIFGAVRGRQPWLFTVDGAGAIVAFVAAAAFRTPEMTGVALWGLLGIALLVVGLFSLAVGVTGWAVWVQIVVGAAFLALVVAGAASLGPSSRRRPLAA